MFPDNSVGFYHEILPRMEQYRLNLAGVQNVRITIYRDGAVCVLFPDGGVIDHAPGTDGARFCIGVAKMYGENRG